MPNHKEWKWLNKIVASMDGWSHTKIQFQISNFLWDIIVERIVHSDCSKDFFTRTEEPDFSQKGFCRTLEDDYFRLLNKNGDAY